ncbi:UDP-glucose 4-epimerase GalE [Agromyces sp. Marseille-P2726]|uniref:UDP-glucose 4-epimerase GalE n=1 Tax=Agromyces sp. Marseille-P2726 TaxID=2709132 RepID=UPI0015703AB5|nr:UDP-glucose 4-epimerase GalE [Agromyces sp. Marseille-P2726]
MATLVTGGAGYIGAHVVRTLQERGERVVVVDAREPDPGRNRDAVVRRLDLLAPGSAEQLRTLIIDEGVEAVIHFAARKRVDESLARPVWYYEQNVGGLAAVLAALEGTAVERFVFSSSAAVYGSPEESFVTELSPTRPINPYGRTKLIGEWMLDDAVRAQSFSAVSLRYFNVAGAGWPDLGDPETLNLVTIVLDRIERGLPPVVFGDDFETPDGSGVRDYVHVVDLAHAHIAALDQAGEPGSHRVFNVGTGVGTSVFELLDMVADVTGRRFETEVIARRAGDPAAVVARTERITAELGWRAEHDLRSIIASAWEAHRHARDHGPSA